MAVGSLPVGAFPQPQLWWSSILLVDQLRLHQAQGDDWITAASTVAARSRAGDEVLLAESEVRPAFEAAWREVDDPPPIPLVNGERPLGEVRRIEPLLSDEAAWSRAATSDRVWLVDETRAPELESALRTLTDPSSGVPSHRQAGTWNAETGVTVHLLIRR